MRIAICGLANLGSGSVDATQNWWGCFTGPGSPCKGTPQVLIEIETKTGHKFTIHATRSGELRKPVDNSKGAPQM